MDNIDNEDYYAVLGVSEYSSEQEIKRAYVRKIKQHSPENDPENFQKIRQAYEVLNDPKMRKQYDERRKYGKYVDELVEKARKEMSKGNYESAVLYLDQALDKAPSLDNVRNTLGICYLNMRQYDKAKREFLRIVQDNPDNAQYLCNLGQVLHLMNDDINAEKYILRAVEINPADITTGLALVDFYIDSKKYGNAIEFLKKLMSTDGKINYKDMPFMLKLLRVYVAKNDVNGMEDIVKKIQNVVPNDLNTKKYVALEFYKISSELIARGNRELAVKIADWGLKFHNMQELRNIKSYNTVSTENCDNNPGNDTSRNTVQEDQVENQVKVETEASNTRIHNHRVNNRRIPKPLRYFIPALVAMAFLAILYFFDH
ncbi:MAG TPA: DnaJ domain-containing protein [Fervidobacterium sp.]|nr:DnaJ domain-containing protein [Fervidobacterium sp.]HQI93294.1 DnaJ domain-containing protein [Fervidobacterium sp.]